MLFCVKKVCQLTVAIVCLGGSHAYAEAPLPLSEINQFAEVLHYLEQYYVDAVDQPMIFEQAIRGMVSSLDPHSAYLSQEEYDDIRSTTAGNYTGIGLEISFDDGVIKVIAPMEGSPAAQAGLQTGDVILFVDDQAINQDDIKSVVKQLRGEVNTQVKITVARPEAPTSSSINTSASALKHFFVTRKKIEVASVRSQWLTPDTAYLRISQFNETSASETRKALQSFKRTADHQLRSLILDLRNNPGGILEGARDIADLFLEQGLIVSANGRREEANFDMFATPGDLTQGANMLVWINAGSASASEIVAGALQDHGRAKVVGQTSFGKGSVQTIIPMPAGQAIKLTTSKYFTPSGDSIHGIGIKPDIELDDRWEEQQARQHLISLLAQPNS